MRTSWKKLLLVVMAFAMILLPMLTNVGLMEAADDHSGTSDYNEADGNKIESVKLVWNTPDTRDNGKPDDLWLSTRSRTPLSMKFTVQVNLSGQADAGDYEPGAIRITIPRQIWTNRNGQKVGKLDMPIGIKPTPSTDWYYEVDGDNYVLINSKKIGATSNHTFECSFYDIDPLMIVDESVSTGNDPENPQEWFAHVEALTSEGNTIYMDSNRLTAQIDTGEKITSVYKGSSFYEFVDDNGGVPANIQALVDNPNDYVFIKWSTYANMSGNQYFDLSMHDDGTNCYRVVATEDGGHTHVFECEGIFLAEVDGSGNILTKKGDDETVGRGYIDPDGKSYKNDYVHQN